MGWSIDTDMPSAQATVRTLLISDGGLCAATCALMDRQPESLALWLAPHRSASIDWPAAAVSSIHHDAAREFAGRFALDVDACPPLHWPAAGAPESEWAGVECLPDGVMLLLAVQRARALGATSVVWPVVAGDSVQWLTNCDQIARHAEQLAQAHHYARHQDDDCPAVEINLPLADLTKSRVGELACDLGVPIDTCWWSSKRPDEPESTLDARMHWKRALREVAVGAF